MSRLRKEKNWALNIAARSWSLIFKSWECHSGQATTETKPQLNDLVIRGYLISMKEGVAKKRFGIGFGEGAHRN